MLDLNDLFFFVAIVRHRGFAPAARALAVPKSSLSRRMMRLEEHYGGRLLERSTRRFQITDLGEKILRHAQAMVTEVEAATEVAATLHAEPRGLVRASCPPGLSEFGLAAVLPRFLIQHPLVRVQILASNRRVDLIEERVDVAIRVRTLLDTDAALTMRMLGRSRLILAASPEFLSLHGMPTSPADLARLPTLSQTEQAGDDAWRLTGPGGKEEMIGVLPRFSSGEFSLLSQAAVRGVGIALLPHEACIREIQKGQLVHVLPDWHGDEALVHMVFVSRREMLPAVRAFVDFLADALPPILNQCQQGDVEPEARHAAAVAS